MVGPISNRKNSQQRRHDMQADGLARLQAAKEENHWPVLDQSVLTHALGKPEKNQMLHGRIGR